MLGLWWEKDKGLGDRGRLAMQGSISMLRLMVEAQPAGEPAEAAADEADSSHMVVELLHVAWLWAVRAAPGHTASRYEDLHPAGIKTENMKI